MNVGSPLSEPADKAIAATLNHVITQYVRQEFLTPNKESTGYATGGDGLERPPIEFVPKSFRYNAIVGLIVLLSAISLLPLCGHYPLAILMIGLTVAYIADFIDFKRSSLVVIMVTLGLLWVSLYVANMSVVFHSWSNLLLLVNATVIFAVCSAWAALQYHWIQVTFPVMTMFCERFVLGLLPVGAIPPMLSLITAIVGASVAPFYFAIAACGLHSCFSVRLRSSFKEVSDPKFYDDQFATGPQEAISMSGLLAVLPSVVYLTTHHATLEVDIHHVLNLSCLMSIPLLYLFYAPRRTLWWAMGHETPTTTSEALRHTPRKPFVATLRQPIVLVSYCCIVNCGVLQLLWHRYGHMLVGVPPPFNAMFLLLAAYSASFCAYLTDRLIDMEKKPPYLWVSAIMLSIITAVLVAIVAGMPTFFVPMASLAVASFNNFLVDRRQINNLMLYLFASSLMLMWWMFKTFSFVVMNLKVFGYGLVPVPAVTITCLWTYILGCLVFAFSFAQNKSTCLMLLILHAMKVTWIEHVLYSQNEISAYNGTFVVCTSALGLYMTYAFHKNKIFPPLGIAVLFGAYIAKIPAYLVYIGHHLDDYAENPLMQKLIVFQISTAWWSALFGAVVACSCEIELQNKQSRKHPTHILGFAAVSGLFAFATTPTFVGPVGSMAGDGVEGFSIGRAAGFFLMYWSAIAVLFCSRYGKSHGFYQKFFTTTLLVGVAAFVVDPSVEAMMFEQESVEEGIPGNDGFTGKWAVLVAAAMAGTARFIPFDRISGWGRLCFWGCAVCSASIGFTKMYIPFADTLVSISIATFLLLLVVVVDLAHYSNASRYSCPILYVAAIVGLLGGFLGIGRVDLRQYTEIEAYMMEALTTCRFGMLYLATCANLAVAVLLKFRLSGAPLLPNPTTITPAIVEQVGIVCNYATCIAFAAVCILHHWTQSSPGHFLPSIAILLLLHDDYTIVVNIEKEGNRYIAPHIAAQIYLLGYGYQKDVVNLKGFQHVGYITLFALVLPAHLLLARLLWYGRRRAPIPFLFFIITTVTNALVLVFAHYTSIRWMALMGIVGHAANIAGNALTTVKLDLAV